jgi:FG-GAP repeat protein
MPSIHRTTPRDRTSKANTQGGRCLRRGSTRVALAIVPLLLTIGLPATARAERRQAPPIAPAQTRSDFNGDGFGDLAVGVPGEDVKIPADGEVQDAGAVSVMYGSALGLSAEGDQLWTERSRGIVGRPHEFDRFGAALASGDLNGDGYADLAVAVEGKDVHGEADAGAVHVLYGSAAGLTPTGDQLWTQDSPGVLDQAEAGDWFGSYNGVHTLAIGDFDGDGFADLVIGVPRENLIPGHIDDGAINVLYGSAAGVTAAGDQFWNQESPGILGDSDLDYDSWGSRVVAGDFNGDGFADLALCSSEDLDSFRVGSWAVLYGSATGLTAEGNQVWNQDNPGILDEAEILEHEGDSLAAGDFDGDGFDDLAVGVPLETSPLGGQGAVSVMYGSAAGLTADGNQFWTQDSPGVLDSGEVDDFFSGSLATGDFDGDGRADLAVGVTVGAQTGFQCWGFTDSCGEDLGGVADAGALNVLYGSAAGLTAEGNQLWSQGSAGVPDDPETDDRFGALIDGSGGDFDGDGRSELAVGVPQEDIRGASDAGGLNVIEGSAGGLTGIGSQFWTQRSPGILGGAEVNDWFGSPLLGLTEF